MKKHIKAAAALLLTIIVFSALIACADDEKDWDISKFPGTVVSEDLDDYEGLEFDTEDMESIEAAIMDYCNYQYGNTDEAINREVFVEYKETLDYAYIFHTYEMYEDIKNYLIEFEVLFDTSDFSDVYMSDLNEILERPQDEIESETISSLMTIASDHLEEKYPNNDYIISYTGQGCHRVYIDSFTYYEISVFDSKKDKDLGYLVLSEETDTAYRRITKDDYIEYEMN